MNTSIAFFSLFDLCHTSYKWWISWYLCHTSYKRWISWYFVAISRKIRWLHTGEVCTLPNVLWTEMEASVITTSPIFTCCITPPYSFHVWRFQLDIPLINHLHVNNLLLLLLNKWIGAKFGTFSREVTSAITSLNKMPFLSISMKNLFLEKCRTCKC